MVSESLVVGQINLNSWLLSTLNSEVDWSIIAVFIALALALDATLELDLWLGIAVLRYC